VARFDWSLVCGSVSYRRPHHLSPRSPLLQFNQALIGVITATNKANGLLYRLTDSGNFEVLHTFGKGRPFDDGTEPVAPVIAGPNGHLYGLTLAGGRYNSGAVYKLNPANRNKVTIVHSFNTEGPFAYCLILGKDGNFYGLASSITGDDIIFMMTPDGQVNRLYTFTFTDQAGTLMQASDGTFYGTTFTGGSLYGTVFKMTGKPPSVTVTILHAFGQGEDGQNPVDPVAVGPNGNLYGETQSGGIGGDGIIYEISTDGSAYMVVHNFSDGSIPNDGSFPNGGLTLGADNNFYGATRSGGQTIGEPSLNSARRNQHRDVFDRFLQRCAQLIQLCADYLFLTQLRYGVADPVGVTPFLLLVRISKLPDWTLAG
jgi:uncharacterized repeat protein (TIGR03803 family)